MAFSPDGQTLASGSRYGTIRMWDIKNSQLKFDFIANEGGVYSVTFSPDGQTLATEGHPENANVLQLWDTATGKQVKNFTGHSDIVTSVVFSPDGATLTSYSTDKTLRIWNRSTGTPLQTVTGYNRGTVKSIMFSSHGRTMACLLSIANIQLWDPNTVTLTKTINANLRRISCIAYSPDNITFACGNSDGELVLLDSDSGEQNHIIMEAHTDRITSVAFSPDASILASCSYDKIIRL